MGQSLKFLGNIHLNLELFIQPSYESNVWVGRDWFVPMLHGMSYWNYRLLLWLGKLAVSTKSTIQKPPLPVTPFASRVTTYGTGCAVHREGGRWRDLHKAWGQWCSLERLYFGTGHSRHEEISFQQFKFEDYQPVKWY